MLTSCTQNHCWCCSCHQPCYSRSCCCCCCRHLVDSLGSREDDVRLPTLIKFDVKRSRCRFPLPVLSSWIAIIVGVVRTPLTISMTLQVRLLPMYFFSCCYSCSRSCPPGSSSSSASFEHHLQSSGLYTSEISADGFLLVLLPLLEKGELNGRNLSAVGCEAWKDCEILRPTPVYALSLSLFYHTI